MTQERAEQIAEWAGKGYRAREVGHSRDYRFIAPDDECLKAWLDGWDAAEEDHKGGDNE